MTTLLIAEVMQVDAVARVNETLEYWMEYFLVLLARKYQKE